MDANAYCGDSSDTKSRFPDGSGCSCRWGFEYDTASNTCKQTGPAPPAGTSQCGKDWADASTCKAGTCVSDDDCQTGNKCFASIVCPKVSINDAPKNCQEMGSLTNCTAMDANAYCGDSSDTKSRFPDGSG